jgi:FOG: TPR repeat, SEL1 subfamily
MEKMWIYEEANKILEKIDVDVYPETVDYLDGLINSPEMVYETVYNIATALTQCDKPQEWTEDIIEYITKLYLYEIDKGNSAAMNDLGAQYYDGNRGFEQNFEKAVNYYKMAAEKGERQAQENLGYCYYYGRDGEPDYEKAFHYFALGAFDGHLISLYKIGDMYYNGYYVEKNLKEAFLIYMRCIETMTEEAEKNCAGPIYLRLGKMFLNGYGTEKDLRSALTCFQKAEYFLYAMVVDDGNYMYKKSLQGAIEGQEKVRAELAEAIPDRKWTYE